MNHYGTFSYTHELFQQGCGPDETILFVLCFCCFLEDALSVGRALHIPERGARKPRDFFLELYAREKVKIPCFNRHLED